MGFKRADCPGHTTHTCYTPFIQEFGFSVYDLMGLVYETRAEQTFVSVFGLAELNVTIYLKFVLQVIYTLTFALFAFHECGQ